MSHKVFVYGTLKQNGVFNILLEEEVFIGEGTISGSLYDLGPFPALILDDKGVIYGEIYEVSDDILSYLDLVESVPYLYTRQKVEDMWVYEYAQPLNGAPKIKSGNWVNH